MKRLLRNRYKKLRFNLSAVNHPIYMGYLKYLKSYKEGSLDKLLEAFAQKVGADFTLIQVGANDGMDNDPVHKFIKKYDWKGVLLEPQKYVFDTFLSKVYQKHPKINLLNAAIGTEEGSMTLYKIGFSEARWATGLASFEKEVLEKVFQNGYAEKKSQKEGISVPEDSSKWITEEVVPIVSVDSLFSDYELLPLHLLQIDTEGYDFEVIKMFDLKKYKPQMISYEHLHLSDDDRLACTKHLDGHGYKVQLGQVNAVAMLDPIDEFYQFTE